MERQSCIMCAFSIIFNDLWNLSLPSTFSHIPKPTKLNIRLYFWRGLRIDLLEKRDILRKPIFFQTYFKFNIYYDE